MIDQKEMYTWMKKAARYMAEQLSQPDAIPESGLFQPVQARFPVSDTKNIGVIRVESKFGTQRQLRFFVQRGNSDLAVSYFMECGTNAQLAAYLYDKSRYEDFVRCFCELSDSVDEQE